MEPPRGQGAGQWPGSRQLTLLDPDEKPRKSILYVFENYGSLATSGSGVVYASCMAALSRDHEVHSLWFGRGQQSADLALPGQPRSTLLKVAPLLSRQVTGKLVA